MTIRSPANSTESDGIDPPVCRVIQSAKEMSRSPAPAAGCANPSPVLPLSGRADDLFLCFGPILLLAAHALPDFDAMHRSPAGGGDSQPHFPLADIQDTDRHTAIRQDDLFACLPREHQHSFDSFLLDYSVPPSRGRNVQRTRRNSPPAAIRIAAADHDLLTRSP